MSKFKKVFAIASFIISGSAGIMNETLGGKVYGACSLKPQGLVGRCIVINGNAACNHQATSGDVCSVTVSR